ncbi:hypothetical protein HGRIS_006801 [Hohenbuehelia grisea]|uniref:Major facilitator superfamily (MFS) profile domain-containing protein n=1 Tax=Hohenbuehelia grisea TaxID=104357 RepID=A0ABR3JAD6_9AGAR
MARHPEEEADSLLQVDDQHDAGVEKRTPLPWFQIWLILFLQLAEPLTSNVIYPFAPQLIRDVGVTHGDETQVGHYVGLMQSLFFFGEALTVLHWARLSDHVGRKPVIMCGLLGISASMFSFGLSRTFIWLSISRFLNGALNGNIGVMKSLLADITDSTNMARVFACLPIVWSTGGTLGPLIGGALSRPSERFPRLFGNSTFLKEHPYFLPCAVPASFALCAVVVARIYLKETIPFPQSVCQYVRLTKISSRSSNKPNVAVEDDEEKDAWVDDSALEKPISFKRLLTFRVVIAASSYALLSLVEISFRSVQPVFFSTPLEYGGLGLSPSTIGRLLSVFGIMNGVFQVMFFTRIIALLGPKRTFLIGVSFAFPVVASFPFMSFLARTYGLNFGLWVVVVVSMIISIGVSLAYGAIFIFIQTSAPNKASLGSVNGLAQMSVSIMRAIGPATTNSLYSLSLEKHLMGGWFVYYIMTGLVVVALVVGAFLPTEVLPGARRVRGKA